MGKLAIFLLACLLIFAVFELILALSDEFWKRKNEADEAKNKANEAKKTCSKCKFYRVLDGDSIDICAYDLLILGKNEALVVLPERSCCEKFEDFEEG